VKNLSRANIGFASLDWSVVDGQYVPNGCTWYRSILPSQQLNLAGVASSFGFLSIKPSGEFVIKRLNGSFSQKNNVVVLKVIMSRDVLERIPKAQSIGQKIVVDMDDLYDELHTTNLAYQSSSPKSNKDNNREIYAEIIRISDALICSTPFIRDYFTAKYPSKPIFMVRNAIQDNSFKRLKAIKRAPVIGWLGATPWRSMDLEVMQPFLNSYLEKNDIKFHHAGHLPWAPAAYLRLGISPNFCTVSGMVPLFEMQEAHANFDIGVVPLNDIPFNRAKSFIKGVEYAASGIPFVASALPEYEYLASMGVGRVAASEADWINHFDELLKFQVREQESRKIKKIIDKEFTMSKTGPEWISVFGEIINL
jgi:hypothetical protein